MTLPLTAALCVLRHAVVLAAAAASIHAQSYSAIYAHPGVGNDGDGMGIAVANLDGNSTPDLIVMAYDDPAGQNGFRYYVGRDISISGQPYALGPTYQVNGLGHFGEGAGIAVGQIDSNPRPDMVLVAYDPGSGSNPIPTFRWIVGFNVDANGFTQNWSAAHSTIGTGGANRAGAGVALAYIDSNPAPDMILMAYVGTPPTFTYEVGMNLGTSGAPASWSSFPTNSQPPFTFFVNGGSPGIVASGADVAVGQLDLDPRPDVVLMAFDANSTTPYRYRIGYNLDSVGRPTAWSAFQTSSWPQGFSPAGATDGAGLALYDFDGNGSDDILWSHYQSYSGTGANSFFFFAQPSRAAAVTDMPTGCVGPGGPLVLAAQTMPRLGTTFMSRATGFANSTWATHVLGFTSPGIPLSQLIATGLPGCPLLSSAEAVGTSLSVGGASNYSLGIPNNPAFLGIRLYHQFVQTQVGVSGAWLSVSSSNGLRLTLGSAPF